MLIVPTIRLKNHKHVWMHPRDWRLLPWCTRISCKAGCCIDVTFTFLFYAYISETRNFTVKDITEMQVGEDTHTKEKPRVH